MAVSRSRVARLLRGFPEALSSAAKQVGVPGPFLEQVQSGVNDVLRQVPGATQVLAGARHGDTRRSLSEEHIPSGPVEDVSAKAEAAGAWLRSTSQAAVGSSLQSLQTSNVDVANDVFSALGLQVRIISPSSPDSQVHVRVSKSIARSDLHSNPGDVGSKESPREFVLAMRESISAGNMVGVEQYVDALIEEKRLVPTRFLSTCFQRNLYVDVGRLAVCCLQRSLLHLNEANLLGHTLKVTPRPLRDTARHASVRRRRRSSVSEEQLRLFVDELFQTGSVHMAYVPRSVQRSIYVNCIGVIFQLMEDILLSETEEVVCMGHRVRFGLEPLGKDVDRLWEDLPDQLSNIDEVVVNELVDELLADSAANSTWMPDAMEKQLYKGVLRLLLRIMEHTVSQLRLNVLGREVRMSVLSSLEASISVRQTDYTGSDTEATMYTEEDDPLRTVSYTELEERLRDLTEQRRILRAVNELGSASFDVTADTPMLKHDSKQVGDTDDVNSDSISAGGDVEAGGAGEEVHEFQRLAHTMKLARSLGVKFEVIADVEVAYQMIADVTTYPSWMPWCTAGHVPELKEGVGTLPMCPVAPGFDVIFAGEEQLSKADVTFGFETGTFLGTVGDVVKYTISVRPPVRPLEQEAETAADGSSAAHNQVIHGRVVADAVNGFTYAERLVYDWRFHQIGPKKTKVELDMMFQARSVLYMPIWDSMQNMIINKMLAAFVGRAEKLQRESDAKAE